MKKYELTKIGEFHTNHNEDYLIANEIGCNKIMIAVMDGCSMGTESHFASILMGKILKKLSTEMYFKEFAEKTTNSIEQILYEVTKGLFQKLKALKNELHLEREELLSTMILGIVDKKVSIAEIIIIGDGVVVCDGVITAYEQDNKPDYLGYHLNENFEEWYEKQNQRLKLSELTDISISTDGIFTFKEFDTEKYPSISAAEILDYLLIDKQEMDNENMLLKKMIIIQKKWGLKPSDDLTILRLVVD